MGYPKPNGYVGSGDDVDMMRQGTGGRLSNKTNPDEYTSTDGRRNPSDLETLSSHTSPDMSDPMNMSN